MHPEVDFYILKESSEQARNLLACKLAAKAFATQQRLYIYCNDQQQALAIDDMLWSFNDISFIPHALTHLEYDASMPILIGYTDPTEQSCDILLNLHLDIPSNLENVKRIIEIVYQDAEAKKIARAHYKAYQDGDFPLKSHSL